MDDAAVGAVSAVWHSDTTRAEEWFDVIGETYRGLEEPDWSGFKQALGDRASAASFESATVDDFVAHLESESSEPLAVVAQLADPDERDTVLRTYAEALDAAEDDSDDAGEADETEEAVDSVDAEGAEDEEPVAAFDQQEWTEYLARWNGEWDGRGDTWDEFAAGLTYYAPAGCQAIAAQMVAYLAGQPDRVAALAEYGIAVADAPVSGEAAADEVVPEAVEAEIVEKVFEPAMAQLFDNIDALAAQLGMTPGELRAEIDGLPAEFFAEVITEAVTEAA